nr:unnamed protein product [Digitaria exilis]
MLTSKASMLMLIARAVRSVAAATDRFACKPEVKFVVQEKDVESDEAMWALYERWRKAFNQERGHDEMDRRFNKFKDIIALLVNRNKNAIRPFELAINKFADGKLIEKCRNPDNRDAMIARKVGNSWALFRQPGDRFLRQVFADFNVVNGKVFVCRKQGSKGGSGGRLELEELNNVE